MSNTFGLFNTSIMGMSAQSDALANISENIANANTIGYKKATTHFLTVLNGYQSSDQFGGGVYTRNRYNVSGQGSLQSTLSTTDLAVSGKGFFVVSDSSGGVFLTRAGSFVPDAQGRLVNAAGYFLMGFPADSAPSASATNALTSMSVVRIRTDRLYANPTTTGSLAVNLPSSATTIAAANLPSGNTATSAFSAKTSVTTYDNMGAPVVLDVYYAKTGANTWEMTVFNRADAAAGGGFPYSAGPLTTATQTFSAANGQIISPISINVPVPGGATMALDMSNTTQLGAAFSVQSVNVNGNAASSISQVVVSQDGKLNYQLQSGQSVTAYLIGLANVNSPENLGNLSGNVFSPNADSGQAFVGLPGNAGFGLVMSSKLEASTVDLATELSSMIISQRAFTANSQAFQVASDILQVLNNLK